MTVEVKIRRSVWREDEHPRDRKGRFIETGAEVRVWGGFLGRVLRNIGGGRIELERLDTGAHVIVHRNYLTVTKRPDGSAPTDRRADAPAALPEVPASPDAAPVDIPSDTVPNVDTPAESGNLYDLLSMAGRTDTADLVRQAARDYQAALDNGTANDEADERDGLLAILDDIDFAMGQNNVAIRNASQALREAAVMAPDDPAPEPEVTPYGPVVGERGVVTTRGGDVHEGLIHTAGDGHLVLVVQDDGTVAQVPPGDVREVAVGATATTAEPDPIDAARQADLDMQDEIDSEEQDRLDAERAAARERQRIADNIDLYGSPEIPTDADLAAEEAAVAAFEKGEPVRWHNPDPESFAPDADARFSHLADEPGMAYIDVVGRTGPPQRRKVPLDSLTEYDVRARDERGYSLVRRRDTGGPGGMTVDILDADGLKVGDGEIGDGGRTTLRKGPVEYSSGNPKAALSGIIDRTLSAVYDGGNERSTDERATGRDREGALGDAPADGDAGTGVLRDAGGAGAGADRHRGGAGGDADAGGGDLRAADEPTGVREERRGGDGGPGDSPTGTDGADRDRVAGGPGTDRGAGGLRDGADGEPGDAGVTVTREQVDADLARAREALDNVPDATPTEQQMLDALNALSEDDLTGPNAEARVRDALTRPGVPAAPDRTVFDGETAVLGSWEATPSESEPGVIEVTGKNNVRARLLRTGPDGAWNGRLMDRKRNSWGRQGDWETVEGSQMTDADPGVLLDRLYDFVNGDGAAARQRNEKVQGRPDAPEVGITWESTEYGAEITVPAGQGDLSGKRARFERTMYSYKEDSVAVVVSGHDPDDDEKSLVLYLPKDSRPVPAPPRLGDEEGDLLPDETSGPTELEPEGLMPVVDGGTNFRPTGLDDLAPAGPKSKLRANLAALRTLRDLRSDPTHRPATPEEQAILARWAGWGGLPDAFDPDKPDYAAERDELRDLLTDAEWAEARRNTLNAHYTDPRAVEAIWTAVQGLGFDGGRVLEPGSGSGTFIGYAPEGTDMIGVELDSTTAAISQYLYPQAQIRNEGFQHTRLPDGVFDAAVGNVPFGKFALNDPGHNADGHSIHNHFILKSIALTRPGGIIATLSSRYTLDSLDSKAREAMYKDADLIGAVRLPNGSHSRIAGTDVIEDVLIFRKRLPGEEPGDNTWVTSTKRDLNGWNVGVNHYFDAHPDHALGDLTAVKGRFGGEVAVLGDKDMTDLPAVLGTIVADARAKGLTAAPRPEGQDLPELLDARSGRYDGHIAADGEGGFTQAQRGTVVPFRLPRGGQAEELTALLGIRDAMDSLLDAETADANDTPEIAALRQTLNDRYDAYVAAYGPINRFSYTRGGARKRPPLGGFRSDPRAAVVAALETYEPPERGVEGSTGRASKAAIFTTRAVAPRVRRTTADTPQDAITLSMDTYGEVNLAAIAKMLGTDEPTARQRLGALVFEIPEVSDEDTERAVIAVNAADDDPTSTGVGDIGIRPGEGRLVPAAEYLSGNVRRKLAVARAAAAVDSRFESNVEALRGVIPRDLGPAEIDAKLGAVWIDEATVEEFIRDTIGVQSWSADQVSVSRAGSIWRIKAPTPRQNYRVSEWQTEEKSFHSLMQSLLEQRSITVTKEGRKDLDATLAAQEKAEQIQERFTEWVWEDPERARRLTREYNDRFNAIALRTYDGSGRTFDGMSEEWQRKVQPHVKNAVERIVNEPTAMLAHVVGAGKTAEMVMGTQELKRLGLARKPAVIVPNHMLEQFSREYLEIYPAAKILTAGQGMSPEERREFVARAATGDWDAVILTQGAFEAIPVSAQEQERYIAREMAYLREQYEQAKANAGNDKNAQRTVKAMENTIIRAENALRKKLEKQKDLGVSWEQTGIDYLMVDEAHMYSNLRTLSNIPNAGTAGSDKATDLHMKMQYLRDSSRSGRIATFATGTPIRNTVTQAYVMQRYLRPDLMEEAGVHNFDQWAATFGSVVEEMELKPEGKGFRTSARFAKFRNVPEFLRMFHTFADVKMREDLNLPTPTLRGGQAQTVAVPRSEALAAYVDELGNRADEVRSGAVDPTEDNMLKISTDGRKAALSMALVGGTHEPGKIEAAADKIGTIYEANKDKVYGNDPIPGALQIVFMDMGTPKGAKGRDEEASVDDNEVDWNGYDHLKAELVARGVPEDKIRYIHEAKTDTEKAELFAAAKNGKIAVLIGSSEKMGVGTNIQRRAKALHHIDAPWRPADVEQRDGRIHRQGNLHMTMGEDVEIYRYVTEGSFDAYMWQTLERKAKFINQVMRGSLDVREIEDVGDTAMSYAEVKALATGNPDLLDKAKADTQLTKLQRLERTFARTQSNMAAESTRLGKAIDVLDRNALFYNEAIAQRTAPRQYTDAEGIERVGYAASAEGLAADASRSQIGQVFADALTKVMKDSQWGNGPEVQVGEYGGFLVTGQSIRDQNGRRLVVVRLAGSDVEIGRLDTVSPQGVVQRLDNYLNSFEKRRDEAVNRAADYRGQIQRMKDQIGKAFARQTELAAWKARADRLAEKIRRDESRASGSPIPFDPRIDSDQYDDPRTRSSAETFVPPPEPEPARVTVLATSLNLGARIEFVLGEVSGTTAEGEVVSIKPLGNLTMVTIRLDNGQEVHRAYAADAEVVKVGNPSSVVGVKGLSPLVLMFKDGRVIVTEVKRGWQENLHPRDRNGRFIETFAEVRIWGGGRGKVQRMLGGGRVEVQRTDGSNVIVDSGNLTVLDTPDKPDTPDTPDVSAPADATPVPTVDAPAAPAPGAPTGRTPAPDAEPDLGGDTQATFTAADGSRAWLNVEDGQPVGYMQRGDGDPERYDDAEAWAADVDAAGMDEDTDGGSAEQQRRMVQDDLDAGPEQPGRTPNPDYDPEAPAGTSESFEFIEDDDLNYPTSRAGVPDDPEARAQREDAAAAQMKGPEGDPEVDGDGERAQAPANLDTPATDEVMAAHNNPGRVDGTGTVDDPIDVQGDLDKAAQLISDGKHVRLNKVEEVSILLDKLAAAAADAEAKGDKAPSVDVCRISVPKTNLFCQQSKGIPRIEMPQFSGTPVPGSPADSMQRNKRGRVDVTDAFLAHLEANGIGVEEKDVPASFLKATQAEMNGSKIGGMMRAMSAGTLTESPVFVTRDGYVIDGHHRWAAKVGVDAQDGELGDVTMPVRMLDMEIGEALDFANAFTADIGIKSQAMGEGSLPTAQPGALAGVAHVAVEDVDHLLEAMGQIEDLDLPDDTDLPVRLSLAAADYDTALSDPDPKVRAAAHVKMSKVLAEADNALDNGDTTGARGEAMNALATIRSSFDANVPVLFPFAGQGGTEPDLSAPTVDEGTVKDLMSNAGSPDILNGGSGAQYLVKGSDGQWRFTAERQALHDALLDDLLDGVPVSDDPRYNFFGGGPASGKGSITRMFPHLANDAVYLNPDDFKFALPEMRPRTRSQDPATRSSASSYVHEESSYLAKYVQKAAFERGHNVTLDGTGDSSAKSVRKKLDAARKAGYKIDAYYVSVPVEVAIERADWRAKNGTGSDRGREVPARVIEKTHMEVSQVLPEVANDFDSLVVFDTNVPFGTAPNLMARKDPGGEFTVVAPEKWQEFLDKGTAAPKYQGPQPAAAESGAPDPGAPEGVYNDTTTNPLTALRDPAVAETYMERYKTPTAGGKRVAPGDLTPGQPVLGWGKVKNVEPATDGQSYRVYFENNRSVLIGPDSEVVLDEGRTYGGVGSTAPAQTDPNRPKNIATGKTLPGYGMIERVEKAADGTWRVYLDNGKSVVVDKSGSVVAS